MLHLSAAAGPVQTVCQGGAPGGDDSERVQEVPAGKPEGKLCSLTLTRRT